jgi:hypothetical protein
MGVEDLSAIHVSGVPRGSINIEFIKLHGACTLFKAAVINAHHLASGDCEYELHGMLEEVVVA